MGIVHLSDAFWITRKTTLKVDVLLGKRRRFFIALRIKLLRFNTGVWTTTTMVICPASHPVMSLSKSDSDSGGSSLHKK